MLDIFNIKVVKDAKKPFTVVISKKYIKKSTKRNLLKRRASYAEREILKERPNLQGKSFTLYVKRSLEKVPNYKTIKENICGIQ